MNKKKKLVVAIAVSAIVAGSAWYIYKVRSYLLMKVNEDGIKEDVSALPHTDTWNGDSVRDSRVEAPDNNGVSDTGSIS
jgi:hypothetical protein